MDPYGLFPSYRKRYAKKKTYVKKKSKSKVQSVSRRVTILEAGIEHKIIDINHPPVAYTQFATGTGLVLLNGVTQGDTIIHRDGQDTSISSIYLRLLFNADTAADSNLIRVLLVRDKQPNGAAPALGLIISDVTAGTALVSDRKTAGRKRFVIMMDRKVKIRNGQSNEFSFMNYFKRCKLKVNYGLSNNGDITDIATNSLFLLVLGFNLLGTWEGFSRVSFTG